MLSVPPWCPSTVFGKCSNWDFLWLSDYKRSYTLFCRRTNLFLWWWGWWWWGKQNSCSQALITPPWQGLDCLSVPVKQELWFALLPRAVDDQPWSAPSIPQLDTVTVSKRRKKGVLWMDANEFLAAKVLVFSTTNILFATMVSSPPLFLFAHFPFSIFPLFLLYFH